MKPILFMITVLSCGALPASCASAEIDPAAAAPADRWESISDGVLEELAKAGAKIGYPGKTGGIAVDPQSGDVYMVICDQGVWKSVDHGGTFARCDAKTVSGRCETGWAANVDPAGKRLAMFMVYAGGASTDDSGKTWTAWKESHFDAGAVDWESGGKTLLALKHESGGDLVLSADGGKTWKSLGKGFSPVLAAFDGKTLMARKGRDLLRTEDAGVTWEPVKEVIVPQTGVVRVLKGTAYLASPKGVQVTKDKGKTWSVMGTPIEALFGPYLKDEETMIVVTPKGFAMTENAGRRWRIVATLPPDTKVDEKSAWYPNFGWDPRENILYAATMGKPAYRCALPRPPGPAAGKSRG